jgi:hypothetical protein
MRALIASSKLNGCNETGLAFGMAFSPMAETTENFPLGTLPENASAAASSASCYHRLEYIRILPVIVPELKLRQIQRQIFLAHLVIRANDAAFEQAPKRIQIRGMNIAAHIFALSMGDRLMGIVLFQVNITVPFVGRDQRNPIGNGLSDETINGCRIGSFNDFRDDVPLARDSANNATFATRASPDMLPLVAVLIFLFPADVGFIYLYFSHELSESTVTHRSTDSVAHIPSRSILTATDLPVNLKRRHALLTLGHKIDHLEPSPKRVVGILENCLGDYREPIAIFTTAIGILAGPVKRAGFESVYFFPLAATRAFNAIGPAESHKVRFAILFGFKTLHHDGQCHTRFGSQFFHRSLPPTEGNIAIPRVGVKCSIIAQI